MRKFSTSGRRGCGCHSSKPGSSVSARGLAARHSCAVSHQLFTEQGLTFPQTEAPPTCRDRSAGERGTGRRWVADEGPHQMGTAPRASSARPPASGGGQGQHTSSGDLRDMHLWWDTG